MKQSTFLLAILALAAAAALAEGDKTAQTTDKSGIPPRSSDKVPPRCKGLETVKDRIAEPPTVDEKKAEIDRGSDKGNPLCNHDVWQLIDKDSDLHKRWDLTKSMESNVVPTQVGIINDASKIYADIDKQVDKAAAAAEDVMRSGANLNLLKATIAPVPMTVNPNRETKDKITVVTKLDMGSVADSALAGDNPTPQDLHAAAAAINDIATGGDPGGPIAGSAKPLPPTPPALGTKMVAYLNEVQKLHVLLEGLKSSHRVSQTPGGRYHSNDVAVPLKDGKPAPLTDADRKKIKEDVDTVFKEMPKNYKESPASYAYCALGYFDPRMAEVMAAYDKKVWDVYDHLVKVTEGMNQHSPGALAKYLEARAADKDKEIGKNLKLNDMFKAKVTGEGGIDSTQADTTLTPEQRDFKAGTQTIQVTPGKGTGDTTVTYTPNGRPTKSVAVKNPDNPDEVSSVSHEIAGDIAGGNDNLARLKAAKAAVTGDGGDKTKTDVKPGDLAGNIDIPAASGLKSSCGAGKTLADMNKEAAEARAADSADDDAERTKAEEEQAKAYEDADKEYKAHLNDQIPRSQDPAYAKYMNARAEADKKFAAATAKLGTREGQKEKYTRRGDTETQLNSTALRSRVAQRILDLPKEWRKREDPNNSQSPVVAAQYVKNVQRRKHLDEASVDTFFKLQFPQDQRDPYKHNIDTCADPNRAFGKSGPFGSDGDIDRCVGAIYSAWTDRVAANVTAGAAPIQLNDADKARQTAYAAQREKELKQQQTTKTP